MKKYIAILLLAVISQAGYAQKKVDDLFKEFARSESSVSVKMGKFTMKLASLFTDTFGVDGLEVYAFEDCSSEFKERLTKAIGQLKDNKYETMVSHNEDGQKTRVLFRLDEDMIKEIVVLTTGNEAALVRIKGNIKPSDIERVVQNHSHGGS